MTWYSVIIMLNNTLQDQRQIEGSLANDENSSDEEMLADFIKWCPGFDPALLERITTHVSPVDLRRKMSPC